MEDALESKFLKKKPQGYNIGINEGTVAGQTIMHLHIHMIPRYKGDVENPVGGVRNIFPGKGNYKK
ncbi:HIT family protein [Candidatus Woesearchaeota archaeon]|nr:HIT family protein [Candidatus Woesearchaeota archaeon]